MRALLFFAAFFVVGGVLFFFVSQGVFQPYAVNNLLQDARYSLANVLSEVEGWWESVREAAKSEKRGAGNTPDTSNKIFQSETSVWKEYKSTSFHVSFFYPPEWILKEQKLSPPLLGNISAYEGEAFLGTILVSQNITVPVSEMPSTTATSTTTTISIEENENIQWIRTENATGTLEKYERGGEKKILWYRVTFQNSSLIYEISFSSTHSDAWKLVLNTIRFLK